MKNLSEREQDEGCSRPDPKKQKISFPHTARVEEEPAVVLGRAQGDDEEVEVEGFLATNAGSLGYAEEGPISFTLTDPEVLDCSICCEALTVPVFQCGNGHIACSTCCIKMRNRCPSCCTPIGSNRCRAIEKVLESITVSCKNRNYGCSDSSSYIARRKHEEVCAYTPCSCPFADCNFKGPSKQLSDHISRKHRDSARRFKYQQSISFYVATDQRFLIFQEERDGSLFILNNTKERLGNVMSVSQIGPPTINRYSYELVARLAISSLRLQSFTSNIQKRDEALPSNNFLLVPSHVFVYKMELFISGP